MTSRDHNRHWANRYIFLENIGKGSFGIVYKVKDVNISETELTIKVLKEISVGSMNKDEMDECTREGKLLSKLNHPHIVHFFDSFCCVDNYCIITEYCEGGDLSKIIKLTRQKGEYLEKSKIFRWFGEIIQGLNYMHENNILHRDLNPRNIFLKRDSAKIGDFGLSRILNFTLDLASTFLGTPHYMSPEIFNAVGYNAKSDIWSAGIIFYEMCTLHHPFTGQNMMDIMVNILTSSCPKLPMRYSEIFQMIMENILIKDPKIRPSASEILTFLHTKTMTEDPTNDDTVLSSNSDKICDTQSPMCQFSTKYLPKSVSLEKNGVTTSSTPNLQWKDHPKFDVNDYIKSRKSFDNYNSKEHKSYNSNIFSSSFIDSKYRNSSSSLSDYVESNYSMNSSSKSDKYKESRSSLTKKSDKNKTTCPMKDFLFNFYSIPTLVSTSESYGSNYHSSDKDSQTWLSNSAKEFSKLSYSFPERSDKDQHSSKSGFESQRSSKDLGSSCDSRKIDEISMERGRGSSDPYSSESKKSDNYSMKSKFYLQIDKVMSKKDVPTDKSYNRS